jgi:hypothetical protein
MKLFFLSVFIFFCCQMALSLLSQLERSTIDIQKIHFARQQGGDNTVVYLRPITQRSYFSECLYVASTAARHNAEPNDRSEFADS